MLQEGQAGKEKPGWDKPGRDGELRSTIIIPNYNGIKYIENCLVSLADEPARVVVVDNGSADGSRELVQEKFPHVQVISLDKNYGFCGAVNRGIAESGKDKTPYVILLNNDTVVESGFVRALEKALDGDQKAFSGAARMVNMYRPEVIDDAGDYYCALGGHGKFSVPAGAPAYTAGVSLGRSGCWTRIILPIWRMWISATAPEYTAIAASMCRRRWCVTRGAVFPAPATTILR